MRRGALILMYHSVAEGDAARFIEPANRMAPALFERQMAFLAAHRRVVSLSQLVAALEAGEPPVPGTVCITFDDGYLDNLTVAAPILEKHRLPATLFLATGFMARGEAQWSDLLHWFFTCRTRDPVPLPDARLLHARLLEAGREERAALLGELRGALAPAGTPPRLMLDWDDARALRRRYPRMEIGGHTRDHLDLTRHDAPEAREQVAGCADDLRRELGLAPGHFSFPYERWCPRSRDAVIAGGWKSAVGAGRNRRVGPHSDRFALPRLAAPRGRLPLWLASR